jgi:hypothetical protein
MKKRLWTLLLVSSRNLVLGLVALSLIAAIAFPSVTVRVPVQVRVEPPVPSEQKQLLAGAPDTDETTGNMGTGRKQQAAPIMVAVPPSPLKFEDNSRRYADITLDTITPTAPVLTGVSFNQTTSLPHVSSKVARQLTLVGAKPSGTM